MTTAPLLPPGKPDAELSIDATLIRDLLSTQHPDLAELPLEPLASGWDNQMFRLGEQLTVRLPRRKVAVALIEHEQRWLPTLASHLPLPIPAPVRIGIAGEAYPWPWSILPWFEGGPVDLNPPDEDQGGVLGRFLGALHRQPLPTNAPTNPARDLPLLEREPVVAARIAKLRGLGDYITDAATQAWDQALAALIDVSPTWLHGDLHARNVLTNNGKFSAIIDWGDTCGGDRATDLAGLWTLLPTTTSRAAARAAYGDISDATWARAKGWAISFAVTLIEAGLVNDPRMVAIGTRTMARVSEPD
jgi:aminoglycoside phosphotransferase (APT) family kinase protein